MLQIFAAFRNLSGDDYFVEEHVRLVQICDPELKPFLVRIVNQLSETSRGEGGFGSTGA